MLAFLDASAIIYLLEGDTRTREAVRQVLRDLEQGDVPPALAVSSLSRLECRVRPLRESNTRVLDQLDAFFGDPGLSVIALDTAVLDKATELRAHHGLRTPDAIQAASLLAVDPEGAFVTGDGDFKKVPGLRVHQIPR
ncbi:VapC toxin family PIN domain ribonuclease [Thioalkalivibrio denitrificans]|uniref:Ribonuclease VapC n=1 Tax=Thioalkalivibrio denitrificans TaxID=108003 RepID=A0A1V3NHV9_9GAMM|nr:PIN domain-containing protein [Thioalkalivibrio denitrificans]OOG24432.1 VapC toxin family PIN domain ribonuclease [Thioalkalivibrio denitrificans]